MVKVVALGIGVLVAGVLIYAATRPGTFEVKRSITVAASPQAIFPLIDDFRSWASWSPYEKLDPAMKRSFSGPQAGPGAVYAWDGNGKVGKGQIEITGANPPSAVELRLDMFKPFAARNAIEFTLQPQGSATVVTWAMRGPTNYVSKLMGVFINMDRMIGGEFATGLASLKVLAERQAASGRPAVAAAG